MKELFRTDDTFVTIYASEVQEDTRAKLPWLIRTTCGNSILQLFVASILLLLMIIAREKSLGVFDSPHNSTKHERYNGGILAGFITFSSLMLFLFLLNHFRNKYVESSNHSARDKDRQLFGFFRDESSSVIEQLKIEQRTISFLSEENEELLPGNFGNYEIKNSLMVDKYVVPRGQVLTFNQVYYVVSFINQGLS